MSRGPVFAAYADGALGVDCPNCRVGPGDFCVHADGTLRRIPCCSRLSPIADRDENRSADESAAFTGGLGKEGDQRE